VRCSVGDSSLASAFELVLVAEQLATGKAETEEINVHLVLAGFQFQANLSLAEIGDPVRLAAMRNPPMKTGGGSTPVRLWISATGP
jgi:hypothetical protein